MNFFKPLVLLLLAVSLSTCQKDEFPHCGKRHYYYFEQQIQRNVSPNRITVGFTDSLSFEAAKNILAQYPGLEPLTEGQFSLINRGRLALPVLSNWFSCSHLEQTMNALYANSSISFVNNFLSKEGEEPSTGITDEFIVYVKDTINVDDLMEQAAITKTKIDRQSEFDKNTYILKADRNSSGDALDMANYFHETGLFRFAQPNFIIFLKH